MEKQTLRKIIEEQYFKMYLVNEVNMVRASDIDDLVNAITLSPQANVSSNEVVVAFADYIADNSQIKYFGSGEDNNKKEAIYEIFEKAKATDR